MAIALFCVLCQCSTVCLVRWQENCWWDGGVLGNMEPQEVEEVQEDEQEEAGEKMDTMDLLMYGMSIKKSDSLRLDRPVVDFRSEVRSTSRSSIISGVKCLSYIRKEKYRPATPMYVTLRVPPPWILKQGGLESSGQRLIP